MGFDVAYQIHDHFDDDLYHPLATVMMHEKESYHKRGSLYRLIERYELYSIKERFGISFNEFIELPHDVVESMFDIAFQLTERQRAVESNAESKARQELEHDSRKLREHFRSKR